MEVDEKSSLYGAFSVYTCLVYSVSVIHVVIWRQLKQELADEIALILNEIFLERGPVEELLMHNATVFLSELLKRALDNNFSFYDPESVC